MIFTAERGKNKMKKPKFDTYGYFHHKEITMPLECVNDCSHQGACDDDVSHWTPKIDLSMFTRKEKITGLKETGGWSREELEKLEEYELDEKIVWIVACDLREELDSICEE
jgi:hypothetical protein